MKIVFCSSFSKDLSKIDNTEILIQVKTLIDIIGRESTLRAIPGIKKIKGSNKAYRYRIGDYRIGLIKVNDSIEFSRILHRKEIYRYFPK